jgi:hypothetical protein
MTFLDAKKDYRIGSNFHILQSLFYDTKGADPVAAAIAVAVAQRGRKG